MTKEILVANESLFGAMARAIAKLRGTGIIQPHGEDLVSDGFFAAKYESDAERRGQPLRLVWGLSLAGSQLAMVDSGTHKFMRENPDNYVAVLLIEKRGDMWVVTEE